MAEHIGIFKGREKDYNELILKTLLLKEIGNLPTAWQISKDVYEEKNPHLSLEQKRIEGYRETQKIYSVFIRKNGRLNGLESKGYIQCIVENKKPVFAPTIKGTFATLIAYPDLIENISDTMKFDLQPFIEHSRKQLQKTSSKLAYFGVKIQIQRPAIYDEMIKHLLDRIKTKEGLFELVMTTKNALGHGLDLDSLSVEEFSVWLVTNKRFRIFIENLNEGAEP
jgi:hypothetical protein